MKCTILIFSVLFTTPSMAASLYQSEYLGVISTFDGGATQRGGEIAEYSEEDCEAARAAHKKLYKKMANRLGLTYVGGGSGSGSDAVAFVSSPCRVVVD